MTDLMGKAHMEEWLANNPDKKPCKLLGTPFFENKISYNAYPWGI
jgi:hypothetical protein